MIQEIEKDELKKLLLSGRTVQVKPQGYSMYPMLVPGRDEAILQKADWQRLRRGDVVLYRRNTGILVLHRIKARRGKQFYMVGDNQVNMEGPIEAEQIEARLVGFVRKGREIAVTNPLYICYARLWLVLRPFRRIISRPIASMKKGWRKWREKNTDIS